MTDFLRLLMTPADRERIVAGSVAVTETPFSSVPATAFDPRPESLRLQLRISDPEKGAPQLKMIFPGIMRFEPDVPVYPKVLPSTGNIQMTGDAVERASYDSWPERGKLRVEATTPRIVRGMTADNKITGIGVPPQIAWFEPVLMTLDFLNLAVLNGMKRRAITLYPNGPRTQVFDGQTKGWAEQAVISFYQSLYQPLLEINPDTPPKRELDDVIRLPMPLFPMTVTGDVDIRITLAAGRSRSDRVDYPIANSLGLPEHHPGHPDIETLPTRAFWQRNRAQMIGADAENATVDAIIGDDIFPQTMKQRVNELGFGNLGPTNNTFNDRAHWAVREFQIYSKYQTVATEPQGATGEYADRLQAQVNPSPYTGPLNGFLNTATRERIDLWGRPANRLRCPVVVTARTGDPQWQGVQAGGENIWAHNDITTRDPRVFVRDVSDRYNLPAQDARDATVGGNRYIILGYYEPRGTGGPNMLPDHSWATMRLDSLRLTGVNETTLFGPGGNAAMLSTYMTVLPTIEKEAASRFDVCNAWDEGATLSLPLFHYTFSSGELGGLFAYMENEVPGDFASAITFFGLKQANAWANVRQSSGARTSRMQCIRKVGGTFENVPQTQEDENYFKNWHWFYRAVMANRIFDTWKSRSYNFARWRLNDVRAGMMTNQPVGNEANAPVAANTAVPNLGQIFTSERALAMLLRWHVNRPAHILIGNPPTAAAHLWGAIERAQDPAQNGGLDLNWAGDMANWANDHETALMNGLVAEAATLTDSRGRPYLRVRDDMIDIRDNFTEQRRRPSADRGSFQFHAPLNV
ncbi:hypothetical protein [Mesorhizobium sp. A623]